MARGVNILKGELDHLINLFSRSSDQKSRSFDARDLEERFTRVVNQCELLMDDSCPEYYLFLSRLYSSSCSLPYTNKKESSDYLSKYEEAIAKNNYGKNKQDKIKAEVQRLFSRMNETYTASMVSTSAIDNITTSFGISSADVRSNLDFAQTQIDTASDCLTAYSLVSASVDSANLSDYLGSASGDISTIMNAFEVLLIAKNLCQGVSLNSILAKSGRKKRLAKMALSLSFSTLKLLGHIPVANLPAIMAVQSLCKLGLTGYFYQKKKENFKEEERKWGMLDSQLKEEVGKKGANVSDIMSLRDVEKQLKEGNMNLNDAATHVLLTRANSVEDLEVASDILIKTKDYLESSKADENEDAIALIKKIDRKIKINSGLVSAKKQLKNLEGDLQKSIVDLAVTTALAIAFVTVAHPFVPVVAAAGCLYALYNSYDSISGLFSKSKRVPDLSRYSNQECASYMLHKLTQFIDAESTGSKSMGEEKSSQLEDIKSKIEALKANRGSSSDDIKAIFEIVKEIKETGLTSMYKKFQPIERAYQRRVDKLDEDFTSSSQISNNPMKP